MQVGEYYVAGRRVPGDLQWHGDRRGLDVGRILRRYGRYALSAGYDGLAFVLGWTGGYVLVAILVAPYLRKFGAYTVPDFLSARYGGNLARFIGVVVLFSCSFTYVVAQIYATGIISARFLGLDFNVAVYVGLAGILVCSMLGGMRAVTWTQVAQYIVLIIAYLIPAIWMSTVKTGIPIPQLMQGHGAGEHYRAGNSSGYCSSPHHAVRARWLQFAELLPAHPLPYGRNGVAATHPYALLHHSVGS